MNRKQKETAQRLLAIIVIVAMLSVMGIHPSVIIFFAVVTYSIWRAIQRSEHQETNRIFEFYKSANDIISDDRRSWYGFEVVEVIERGERVLQSMQDPPPLINFALGALYKRAGNFASASEHLSYVLENELSSEGARMSPSPELRRYVRTLRKLEREPAQSPRTLAAIRSLDRVRRNSAADLLLESRERLKINPAQAGERRARQSPETTLNSDLPFCDVPRRTPANPPQSSYSQPPTISEVLRDVYEEEKKTA